jgi:Major Facilitator Superfamily
MARDHSRARASAQGPVADPAGVKLYPKRTALGFSLFVGQAFIYNSVTLGLGTFLVEFYDIRDAKVPFYSVLFAVSNLLGPLLLGKLFDNVGRKPMIAGTYIGSAVVLTVLTILFVDGRLGLWGFMAFLLVTFFLASAGASSADLTVSEIFPMETRALAIAFFYATGTAVGGITGPFLFGKMIETGEASQVAIAFFLGAALMAVGGIVELLFGVKAEQVALEDIAKPLTAQDAEADGGRDRDETAAPSAQRPERDRTDEPATRERARQGRYRLGPGRIGWSPGMVLSAPIEDVALEREVSAIERALANHGPTERRELARLVGARYWGPGRFSAALREAIESGRARRISRNHFGPAGEYRSVSSEWAAELCGGGRQPALHRPADEPSHGLIGRSVPGPSTKGESRSSSALIVRIPLRVRGVDRIQLHADLTMLAKSSPARSSSSWTAVERPRIGPQPSPARRRTSRMIATITATTDAAMAIVRVFIGRLLKG